MAQYQFSLPLASGVTFGVVADTVDELLSEVKQVMDHSDWLREQFAGFEPPAASYAPAEDIAPDGSETLQERVDPWSGEKVPGSARKPAAARSAPSRTTSPHRPTSSATEVQTKVDRYGREWTLGLPEAPTCYCDPPMPAARVKGKGRDSGKPYTQYRCAKGAPDGDFRSKCDYSEFPA